MRFTGSIARDLTKNAANRTYSLPVSISLPSSKSFTRLYSSTVPLVNNSTSNQNNNNTLYNNNTNDNTNNNNTNSSPMKLTIMQRYDLLHLWRRKQLHQDLLKREQEFSPTPENEVSLKVSSDKDQ